MVSTEQSKVQWFWWILLTSNNPENHGSENRFWTGFLLNNLWGQCLDLRFCLVTKRFHSPCSLINNHSKKVNNILRGRKKFWRSILDMSNLDLSTGTYLLCVLFTALMQRMIRHILVKNEMCNDIYNRQVWVNIHTRNPRLLFSYCWTNIQLLILVIKLFSLEF